MKRTNFQYDDWLLVDGKPMQVKAVHKHKLGFHFERYKLRWRRFGLVEPIPLTDEILDKNCERYKWEKKRNVWVVGTCWNIEPNPNYGYILSTLTVDEFGGGSHEPCIPCTYLHEFQHLVSDLRIDKKIEL